MANQGVSEGKAIKKPPVSKQSTPGSAASMNTLPSTARVVKPATSNLMVGASESRGKGGK